ncbi:4'-phosphopantetheinyl transferase [Paenibacillus shirakamiensis]|uniref:4'-phosphopantetheinyl transferase n=1 Tax=Paenibacillus shirakamiensis TaxID=1265935 RepID=A0ABS4JFW6_9BACL|nr:4'-phosphopantetheinyl transferase superfamily protein [Paenibacillus shirakamiensis]MBP2000602.1 4'-phosphopantetheinyl transferase [Paenibacillus shirakamiensis]
MRIIIVRMTRSIPDMQFQELCLEVSPKRQQRILRFVYKKDAERSLLSELIVRYVIEQNLGLTGVQVSFGEGAYGKPFLMGHEDFQYSISHSGDYVVCAFDTEPVGLDIEQIGSNQMDIAARYYTVLENQYLQEEGIAEEEQLRRFYEIWSLKESYMKATGQGLSMPLESFSVYKDVDSGEFRCISEADPKPWYLRQYPVDDQYCMALCSTHVIQDEQVEQWDMMDFIGMVKADSRIHLMD